MSRTVALLASGQVTLNGSGNGQVTLGPSIPGDSWNPSGGACLVSSDNATPQFQCYLNVVGPGTFIGGSQTGNNDTCAVGGLTLYTGMAIIGVWTGGDPGATATFNLSGTRTIP